MVRAQDCNAKGHRFDHRPSGTFCLPSLIFFATITCVLTKPILFRFQRTLSIGAPANLSNAICSTTHGSRFVLSQLQSSPVRVNNWAIYGEQKQIFSNESSRRASRESSPTNFEAKTAEMDSANLLETTFYNPKPNTGNANQVAPYHHRVQSLPEAPKSRERALFEEFIQPLNAGRGGCYYRMIDPATFEVFYPETNQVMRYTSVKSGVTKTTTNFQNISSTPVAHGFPGPGSTGESSRVSEWKLFANPGTVQLRPKLQPKGLQAPHLGAIAIPARNSPQWMAKLVDKRSSVDAEFHTRFPFPRTPQLVGIPNINKSPAANRKRVAWISQTTSTINSVFDLVKQSELNFFHS